MVNTIDLKTQIVSLSESRHHIDKYDLIIPVAYKFRVRLNMYGETCLNIHLYRKATSL